MKNLTLIIHTDAQQDLTDQLRSLEQVSGFTFSHVEGNGMEQETDSFLSARDKVGQIRTSINYKSYKREFTTTCFF